jgi:hypothetical protein
MQDTFGLDLLSDLKEGTTRSNSCIDMVFGRNVDRLTCMNHVSYFIVVTIDLYLVLQVKPLKSLKLFLSRNVLLAYIYIYNV